MMQDRSIPVEHAGAERVSRDLRVFISTRESRCDDCGEDLGRRAWIFLAGDRGALCLACADLDHEVLRQAGEELRDIAKALDTGAPISPIPEIPVPPRRTRTASSRRGGPERAFDDEDDIPF